MEGPRAGALRTFRSIPSARFDTFQGIVLMQKSVTGSPPVSKVPALRGLGAVDHTLALARSPHRITGTRGTVLPPQSAVRRIWL